MPLQIETGRAYLSATGRSVLVVGEELFYHDADVYDFVGNDNGVRRRYKLNGECYNGAEYALVRRLDEPGVGAPKLETDQKDEPGRKDDAGKARIDLIAPEFLFETAAVLEFGAAKYAPRNWEKGMSWGRCFGALMRHMWAWWAGEAKDPETGLSHLAHASACLMFLVAYEKRKIGTDDRFSA